MKRSHLLGFLLTLLIAAVLLTPALLRPAYQPEDNHLTITTTATYRIIESNGLPDHTTGPFPNPNNPFAIRRQAYRFTIPLQPTTSDQPVPILTTRFGVAINGIPFDPAGPFFKGDQKSGWEFEPLHPTIGAHLGVDENNAHTQPGGGYHYHGLPQPLYDRLTQQAGGETAKMTLLGWAADGFPVYGPFAHADPLDAGSPLRELKPSYQLRSGPRPATPGGQHDGAFIQDYQYVPDLGDLDDCNGRFGVTPDFPDGTYYYVITRDFPVIPRHFRASPDPSFNQPGGGPGPGEVPPGLRDYPNLRPPRT
ncbi:YHYH protein [Mucisphaera sp.]|uniref:YHYH protein n=1 Tax=Mucisphaera sp. TaxID=2913024 RepID=UPI003D0E074E